MRILVRGDIHLDLVSDGVPRLEEQERVLARTVEALDLLEVDVFVDLGDLFDRPRPSPTAYAAAVEYLVGVRENVERAYVLAGNHDKVSRGSVSALQPFERLQRETDSIPMMITLPEFEDIEGIRLVFLPFITDWEARNVLGGFDSAQGWLDDFAAGALLDCRRAIAFAHLEVPGARLADDERVQRDVGTSIPEVLLEDDRVLRVYAGHVHKRQDVGKVSVVGSALHVDFGEAGDEKGMLYVEV